MMTGKFPQKVFLRKGSPGKLADGNYTSWPTIDCYVSFIGYARLLVSIGDYLRIIVILID